MEHVVKRHVMRMSPHWGHSTRNEIVLHDFPLNKMVENWNSQKCQPYWTYSEDRHKYQITLTVIYIIYIYRLHISIWLSPFPLPTRDHQDYCMFSRGFQKNNRDSLNRSFAAFIARSLEKYLFFRKPTCAMATSGQGFCSSFTNQKHHLLQVVTW